MKTMNANDELAHNSNLKFTSYLYDPWLVCIQFVAQMDSSRGHELVMCVCRFDIHDDILHFIHDD